jgi:nitrogen fixation protein FixH
MSKRLQFWPGVVFTLIGLNAALVALTVYFAHRDGPIVAETDYYQKAVDWDRAQELQHRSDALGWEAVAEIRAPHADATSAPLAVRIVDRDGCGVAGLAVNAEIFHSAHAGQRQAVTLTEADGAYIAPITLHGPGRYELRLRARGGRSEFIRSLVVRWEPTSQSQSESQR